LEDRRRSQAPEPSWVQCVSDGRAFHDGGQTGRCATRLDRGGHRRAGVTRAEMVVKICGLTRLEDAQDAVERGASAIGFVFWPKSPRFVDPFRARAIAATLPPFVTVVGVFVDQAVTYVNQVASLVRLTAVQLHGAETPSFAGAIARPVIKAIVPQGQAF